MSGGSLYDENVAAIQAGFEEGWRLAGGSDPVPRWDDPTLLIRAAMEGHRRDLLDPKPMPRFRLFRRRQSPIERL